jgi:hypothetical protein
MKIKSAVLTIMAMMLIQTVIISAQTRRSNRAPVARPASQTATSQTAITKDGRTVILKSDGTWEYAQDAPSPSASKPSRRDGVLSIEAGLVYRSGDVKPVARTTFYLLDAHPGTVLREAGIRPSDTSSSNPDDPDGLASLLGLAIVYADLPSEQSFLSAAMTALKPHIVQSIATDFTGKAQFASAPAGTYYLMGASKTPRGMAFWNLKVELNSGQNSITLDQNNAAYAQ